MSLTRATSVLLRPKAALPSLQRRLASSHSHDEHHDDAHHQEDTTVFPKEDFSSGAWTKFALFGLAAVGFYKFAPAPGEDSYVTRFIAHYSTPREVWEKINFKHLVLSAQGSDEALIVSDARRPPIHRYRYPQKLDQYSPHLRPVGVSIDGNVAVKNGYA